MSNPYDPQQPADEPRPPQAPSWPPAPDQGQKPDQPQDQAQDQASYGQPTQPIPGTDAAATQALPTGGYGSPQASGTGEGGDGAAPQGGYGAPPEGGYGAPQQGGYGAAPQGGYGAPQGGYGAPQGGYGAPPGGGSGVGPTGQGQQGTSGLAIASLVTGLLGFLCLTAVAAVVLGIAALSQIKRTGRKGRGLAIAGIVLGVLWMLGAVITVPAVINAYEDGTETLAPPATSAAPTASEPETSEPAPSTEPSTEPSDTATTEPVPSTVVINLGECIDDPAIVTGAADVPQSAVVDCSEPHYAEAYAQFDLPEGDYPGEDAVTAAAETGCDAEFAPFVGLGYQDSVFEVFYYYPTEASWADDRGVVCVLLDPAGEPITGSLAGANR